MNFISWNVNGMRAIVKKNFYEFFNAADADFFNVQETRVAPDEIKLAIPDEYYQYWDSAERPGYAGTAVFTKHKPISVAYGLDGNDLDPEGRTITLEYADFYLVTFMLQLLAKNYNIWLKKKYGMKNLLNLLITLSKRKTW